MSKVRIKHSKSSTLKRVKKRRFLRDFTEENLSTIFDERIASKDNAGIDGVHAHDLKEEECFEIICRKISAGAYRFTPYAEIQAPKGRGKMPRIIALPTVRDQIALSALKDYLHEVFSDDVNRKLPNSYIWELSKEIENARDDNITYRFIKADISGFYDNIDREKLMNFVRRKIDLPEALKLIYRAITNPIVPRNSKRSQRFHYHTAKGVPQGLAISNILANIYMAQFDKTIESLSAYFVRYVDDILILCRTHEIARTMERLHFEVSKLGLKLNEEKTKTGVISKEFVDFLGYTLKGDGRIGIRTASVHRKISSLAGKISAADHKKKGFLKLHSDVNMAMYRKVLIEDVNEEITGALSDTKRYGWLFYFSQMNDIALLHRLDRIVEKLCGRCRTFLGRKPAAIKSFVTGFREIHKLHSGIESSYIPSYDDWTKRKKIEFLRERGKIVKGRTESEIDRQFRAVVRKRLFRLEKDLRNMS